MTGWISDGDGDGRNANLCAQDPVVGNVRPIVATPCDECPTCKRRSERYKPRAVRVCFSLLVLVDVELSVRFLPLLCYFLLGWSLPLFFLHGRSFLSFICFLVLSLLLSPALHAPLRTRLFKMFSRTAEKASSGTRSIKPVFKKLQPQQRLKLEKSSKKVGQILGEMPVIDIVPASPTLKAYTDKPLPEIQSPLEKRGKKAGKGGKAKAKSPPAPVLRYKLTPEPASAPRPATPNAVATLQVPGARPRKAVPYLLDLPSPASMRRYSRYVFYHHCQN